jgi:hypothetical protein
VETFQRSFPQDPGKFCTLFYQYSASTHDGSVIEHQVYRITSEDFKTDGIVGSLGMSRAHDGAVVKVGDMDMTLGMAVKLGLVGKDANGNYHDLVDSKKTTQPQQPKNPEFKPKTIDFYNELMIDLPTR